MANRPLKMFLSTIMGYLTCSHLNRDWKWEKSSTRRKWKHGGALVNRSPSKSHSWKNVICSPIREKCFFPRFDTIHSDSKSSDSTRLGSRAYCFSSGIHSTGANRFIHILHSEWFFHTWISFDPLKRTKAKPKRKSFPYASARPQGKELYTQFLLLSSHLQYAASEQANAHPVYWLCLW